VSLSCPIKSDRKKQTVVSDTDLMVKIVIRRRVHSFYFSTSVPTIAKILAAVNGDPNIPVFKE
jgi:hypothetical protein